MKYLRKFENRAAYVAALSTLDLPNVVIDGDHVYYNPAKKVLKFVVKPNLTDLDEIAEYIIQWTQTPIEDLWEAGLPSPLPFTQEELDAEKKRFIQRYAFPLGAVLHEGDITGSDIYKKSSVTFEWKKGGYWYSYYKYTGAVEINEYLA